MKNKHNWTRTLALAGIFAFVFALTSGTAFAETGVSFVNDGQNVTFVSPTPSNGTTVKQTTFTINVTSNVTINASAGTDLKFEILNQTNSSGNHTNWRVINRTTGVTQNNYTYFIYNATPADGLWKIIVRGIQTNESGGFVGTNVTFFGILRFTIDNTAPSITIGTPTAGQVIENKTGGTTTTFSLSAVSDATAGLNTCTYTLETVAGTNIKGNTTFTCGTGTVTITPSSTVAGHKLIVWVNDTVNNLASASVNFDYTAWAQGGGTVTGGGVSTTQLPLSAGTVTGETTEGTTSTTPTSPQPTSGGDGGSGLLVLGGLAVAAYWLFKGKKGKGGRRK